MRFDTLQTPDRPAPEAVVGFELAKARFDDCAPLPHLGPARQPLQLLAHGLHHGGVRAHFELPAFGIAGALRPHGTVTVVAAKALNSYAVFGGVAFRIQHPVLRTGNGVELRIVGKVLGGVGVVFSGRPFGGRHQHGHSVLGGGG